MYQSLMITYTFAVVTATAFAVGKLNIVANPTIFEAEGYKAYLQGPDTFSIRPLGESEHINFDLSSKDGVDALLEFQNQLEIKSETNIDFMQAACDGIQEKFVTETFSEQARFIKQVGSDALAQDILSASASFTQKYCPQIPTTP